MIRKNPDDNIVGRIKGRVPRKMFKNCTIKSFAELCWSWNVSQVYRLILQLLTAGTLGLDSASLFWIVRCFNPFATSDATQNSCWHIKTEILYLSIYVGQLTFVMSKIGKYIVTLIVSVQPTQTVELMPWRYSFSIVPHIIQRLYNTNLKIWILFCRRVV